MTPSALIEARVARRTTAAQDICLLEIVPAQAARLPAFEAGAHIDVHVGGFVRQYSLVDAPAQSPASYRIAVLRTPSSRGGSAAVHALLHEGASLRISAPRNHFPLRLDSTHAILVAGGIGITPLWSMAGALHTAKASFELHYCGREQARMAFSDEMMRSPFAQVVRVHADLQGKPGFDGEAALCGQPPDAQLYVCGPQGFMDHMRQAARTLRWAEHRLHHESFQPASAASLATDRAFDLIAKRSGRRITVGANETALQALIRAQFDVASSCEQGVCGTCLVPVLHGVVDHRDTYLTAQEQACNDQFLPCCSRALHETLTIDL